MKITDLFQIAKGSTKYTERYYRANAGSTPVYSASSNPEEVAGWVSDYDFNGDNLTWTTNGYAGHVFRRQGAFCATRDVGVLQPRATLRNVIDLDYFVPVLTRVFSEAATGRRKDSGRADYTKLATKAASQLAVPVPVDRRGKPDLALQNQIAKRFKRVADLKRQLLVLVDGLENSQVAFPRSGGRFLDVSVDTLFEVSKGSGAFTARFIRDNPGDVPVYTGSSLRNEVAGYVATKLFDGDRLTWAADGYAGVVYARKGPFSANSHCGVLTPRPEYQHFLHLPYFESVLTPVLQGMAVGRFKSDGSPDYTRVGVATCRSAFVAVPISDSGLPDLQRQKTAARKVAWLRDAQAEVVAEVERLVSIEVDVMASYV